jgi:hypothetical protein
VLGPDVVVVEHPRFFLGEDDHPPRSVGESLEQRTLHPMLAAEQLLDPLRLYVGDGEEDE